MKCRLMTGARRAAVLSVLFFVPHLAHAYSRLQSGGSNMKPWAGNTVHYKINASSFATNLHGLTLSIDDARYWVRTAFNSWRDRSGANVSIIYDGDTSVTPSACTSTAPSNDGSNQVAAVTGCAPGEVAPCPTWAWAQPFVDSSGTIIESDVCVFGARDTWGVRASDIPFSNAKDLIGTLTHEFGHVLTLDHTPSTVMDSPTFGDGNTWARYQYADDWNGIRAIYGVASEAWVYKEAFAGSSQGTGWNPQYAGPGYPTSMNVNAAIGYWAGSGADKVFIASNENGTVGIDFASDPLSGNPTWGGNYLASPSWRPPGIAARLGSQMVVLGYVRNQSSFVDLTPKITLKYSDVDFTTTTNTLLLGDTTVHEPGLTYDSALDKFILVYTIRHGTPKKDNIIWARTAPGSNPSNWTAAQNLGLTAVDSPAIACNNTTCVLTYNTGDTDVPYHRNQSVTLNATTGQLTLQNWVQSGDRYSKAFPAAVYTRKDSYNSIIQYYVMADSWDNSGSSPSDGTYWIGGLWRTSLPMSWSGADWVTAVSNSKHRAALAGRILNANTVLYIFYVP